MKIALLGWGSLLWDNCPEFDEHHEVWLADGPILKLEFSRVSERRGNALTLVIDEKNGEPCQVAYTFSTRATVDDAICDLRCREGTILKKIGCYVAEVSHTNQCGSPNIENVIAAWARERAVDAVVWTNLEGNFEKKSKIKKPFSIPNALSHLALLEPIGKSKAAEYVWRAPDFIRTPLRTALEKVPWFQSPG